MPVYEYECLKCGDTHEAMQKFSDEPHTKCKKCGGTLKKIISNTSFVLKGTGWYKTDYAARSPQPKSETKTKTAKNESSSERISDAKPAKETKTETKTETASKT